MNDRRERPEARATERGNVAYQVIGEARERDILVVPGLLSRFDRWVNEPEGARFLETLTRAGRVILVDRRGFGASDRSPDTALPCIDEEVEHLDAILHATGDRPVVLKGRDHFPCAGPDDVAPSVARFVCEKACEAGETDWELTTWIYTDIETTDLPREIAYNDGFAGGARVFNTYRTPALALRVLRERASRRPEEGKALVGVAKSGTTFEVYDELQALFEQDRFGAVGATDHAWEIIEGTSPLRREREA